MAKRTFIFFGLLLGSKFHNHFHSPPKKINFWSLLPPTIIERRIKSCYYKDYEKKNLDRIPMYENI